MKRCRVKEIWLRDSGRELPRLGSFGKTSMEALTLTQDRELELAISREQEGKDPRTLQSAGVDTALRCYHKERETAAQARLATWVSF